MADSDQILLSYVKETIFGATPATPTLKDVRITGESLTQNTDSVNSAEIRNDRQVADVFRTNRSAGGGFNFELSYGSFEDFIASAMGASDTWAAPVAVHSGSNGISVSVGVITIATTWTVNPAVNTWIYVKGYTGAQAVSNGYYKVTGATNTTITVEAPLPVDATSGDIITITQLGQVVNGTTLNSYVFEKDYTDLNAPNVFAVLNGMTVSQMNLSVASDAIITGNFDFLGTKEVSGSTTIASAHTVVNANEIFTGVEGVNQVTENALAYAITGFDLSVNANLRARQQVATLGPISMGAGVIEVTGTVQAYFNSIATMDRYLNFSTSKLALKLVSTDGAYIIDLPAVKFTSGTRVAGGQNQDIIADMAFTAFRDSIEDTTIRIAKGAI